jgi:archaellum component FlaC
MSISYDFDFDSISNTIGELKHELADQENKLESLFGEIDDLLDEYENVTSKIEDGIYTTTDAAHLMLHAVKEFYLRVKEGF